MVFLPLGDSSWQSPCRIYQMLLVFLERILAASEGGISGIRKLSIYEYSKSKIMVSCAPGYVEEMMHEMLKFRTASRKLKSNLIPRSCV